MRRALIVFAILAVWTAPAAGQASAPEGEGKQQSKPLPTIAEKTAGTEKLDGFFPLYWDAKAGKLWLKINRWNTDFLWRESLAAGVGSNDIGLDRGQPGPEYVVRFERIGPKVLLLAKNYDFRATTGSSEEKTAVGEAFAESALAGFEVAAEDGSEVLVDATAFFVRDAHGVAEELRRTKQGSFRLDPARSAIYLAGTKNFPKNTEVEATLTLTGDEPGQWVEQVTPDPHAVTVREHQSLVELPPLEGFVGRAYDPRCGFFAERYMDFSAPFSEPIVKQQIVRFRLRKKDPSAAMSEPVQPIIYYVDRGAPEPIRSALVEGAGWWNQAFTAAGYKNAFQVELLPEGADPMDIRYNVIEWVPRATRGWSYGSVVVDPRTGEILQGHVTLDALRIRQVFLIAEGLLQPYGSDAQARQRAEQMALARIRQLAAHETGHTLGLEHNFAGSTVNRSSVMDYPGPVVTLGADGAPDVSNAYATGIGEWDKVTIAYGYSDFSAKTNEAAALNDILNTAFGRGQVFLTDEDARPPGSASPAAHLWDVGPNALEGLKQVMSVRAAALQRFSENAIPEGAPMGTLEDVLVPIYLYHRYQVTAVAKSIGGLGYSFKVRGDVLKNPERVPPEEQRRALAAVLETLQPEALELPDALLKLLPPRPPGFGATREDFQRRTAPAFDALAPAEAAAQIVVTLLLEPHRAARMIESHARDRKYPGFGELVDALIAATWKAPEAAGYRGAIQQTVNGVTLDRLIGLAADEKAPPEVRAIASLKLDELKGWLATAQRTATDESRRAQIFFALGQIRLLEEDPKEVKLTEPARIPEGDPIGASGENDFDRR